MSRKYAVVSDGVSQHHGRAHRTLKQAVAGLYDAEARNNAG